MMNKIKKIFWNSPFIWFTIVVNCFLFGVPFAFKFALLLLAAIVDSLNKIIDIIKPNKFINVHTNIENMNVTRPKEYWDEIEKKLKDGGI